MCFVIVRNLKQKYVSKSSYKKPKIDVSNIFSENEDITSRQKSRKKLDYNL